MTNPVTQAIAEYLKFWPSKRQFCDLLTQLDCNHPEERGRLIVLGLLLEFAEQIKHYPWQVIELMVQGAEVFVRELEPFGNHPEDFFVPLLNAGWIKGEALIDKANPPNLPNLLRLKGMLDRDEARRRPSEKDKKEHRSRKLAAIQIALQVLDKGTEGPRRRGRLTSMGNAISMQVGISPKAAADAIRDTVREWERQNPGK